MKILQINKFFYKKGGSEKYFFNLIRLLREKGHQVIPFSMQHPENIKSEYSKYFIKKIDYRNNKNWLFNAPRFIVNLEAKNNLQKLIQKTKPDLAHLHNIHHQLTPAITEILKKYKIPTVQTVHDYQIICPNYLLYTKNRTCQRCKPKKYYQSILNKCVADSFSKSLLSCLEMYYNRYFKDYLDNIDILISPSKFLEKILKEWGINKEMVQLYNFADIKPLKNIQPKNYYLYFGRLAREKGLITLIKAFKQLPQQKLVIAGAGPLKKELMKTCSNMSHIKIIGYQSGDSLTKLIQQAKAVIIPSEWYENNPLSALEALALQKPIIAARIGGLPELIQEGDNGQLFESGNVEDLIEKIGQCNQNKISEVKMLNREQHYQQLLQVYEKVIHS